MLGPWLPTPSLPARLLPAFLRGAGQYHKARSVWLRAQMAFFAFTLVFAALVIGAFVLFAKYTIEDFAAKASPVESWVTLDRWIHSGGE